MRLGFAVAAVVGLSLFGLALQCAGEDDTTSSSQAKYPFVPKPEPCDYEIDFWLALPIGEEPLIIDGHSKVHGKMVLTTKDERIVVCRRDLKDDQSEVCLGNTGDGNTCETNVDVSDLYPDTGGFANKEPDVYNGHNCFKYYDDEEQGAAWADEDGTVWGYGQPGLVSVNFTYPSTPFTRDLFALPSDVSCESHPKILTPPEEEVFAAACLSEASSATPTSESNPVNPTSSENPESPVSTASSTNFESPVDPAKSSSSDMNTACGPSVSFALLLLAAVASLLIF